MSENSFVSELPPTTIFSKLLRYFEGVSFSEKLWKLPHGILKAEEPNLIQGRVYWVDITAEILPKNGGTEVRLSLDFKKHFTVLLFLGNFVAVVFIIFLCIIFKDLSLFEGGLITLLVFDVAYLARREKNEKGMKRKILQEISKALKE